MRLPAVPGPKTSLAERVRWLLEDYWKGNRKKCADDIGVNPTYISRVATETNNPGTDLLEKFAEKPFINTRWLLTGHGTPYLSADQQFPTSWTLPVVGELPNGQIRQPSSLLARHHKEIDVANYSISRCWTQLTISDELAHRGDFGFLVGDYILWETDPEYWRELSIFERRPAVVINKKTNQPEIKVLEYREPEDDEPYISCLDLKKPAVKKISSSREYLLKVEDNRIEISEPTKRKRIGYPIMDNIFLHERRRIIAAAVLRCGNY